MKSPWQLGFLALAVTGVSTYDYVFFKNYRSQKPAAIQMTAPQPAALSEEPLLSPGPEPADAVNSTGPASEESRPSISREDLLRQARQMFVSRDYSESDLSGSWPDRDPFATQEAVDRLPSNIPVIPAQKEAPVPQPQTQPAPQCIFSGTLVQGANRLALVDGTPLAIGDRLGIWQLSRIESDYIVFAAGNETHRIALKGAELQLVRQKDPS
jgi:hypothetical protein